MPKSRYEILVSLESDEPMSFEEADKIVTLLLDTLNDHDKGDPRCSERWTRLSMRSAQK
jgi:hypothetical protein